jgi:signal transduction histidine kinase
MSAMGITPPSRPAQRSPSFFWHGVLIVAPVLVLTAIGSAALWKDRRFVMREAEARSRELTEAAARRIWDRLEKLKTEAHGTRIEFDRHGNLVKPPPYETIPAPAPLNENELNAQQRQLWRALNPWDLPSDREQRRKRLKDLSSDCETLFASQAGTRFAALAHFKLGLALEEIGDLPAATQHFAAITNRYRNALSESGLPLDLLARSHLQPRQQFLSYAVEHPCSITIQLLQETRGEKDRALNAVRSAALARFEEQEELRAIAGTARTHFRPRNGPNSATNSGPMEITSPVYFWDGHPNDKARVSHPPTRWLMTCNDQPGGFSLQPHPQKIVTELVQDAIKESPCPPWVELAVTVAGRYVWLKLLPNFEHAPATLEAAPTSLLGQPLLASAKRGEDTAVLTVSAYLVKKDLLLREEQRRTLWFASIIAAAAAASLVGFISGYRAFHKQHRLAEMKSNFVSGVSHELRAPIASIRLMAEGLERGKISEPSKQHEYFRFIVQECRRLSLMIENVLDFARIDEGRKQYQFEPTDLIALVDSTIAVMQPHAEEHGIKVETQLQGKHLTANVDGQAIQQALINLVDNAIKHSFTGQTVTVSLAVDENITHGSPQRGQLVRLTVQDSGPGIPEAEQQKIFERFYRLGSELRRETPGAGIGLSIVKHIVEAHGGIVRVGSYLGKGSRFIIELPQKVKASPEEPQ